MQVKVGIDGLEATTSSLGQAKIDNASYSALRRSTQHARKELTETIKKVFDRPTPWIQNSVIAQVNKGQAVLRVKDFAGKGTAADATLYTEVHGGQRRQKRAEVALQAYGFLPVGWVCVPGSAAKLDAYGNMARGQIVQILSHLRVQMQDGYESRLGGKAWDKDKAARSIKRAGFTYIVVAVGGKVNSHLKPGVYESRQWSSGRSIRPVLIFVKSATYRVRFPFYEIANDSINKTYKKYFLEYLGELS
jgi:hypothetical protein